MPDTLPIVDLFAGPGGLGEGFSSCGRPNGPIFKIALSVEKDSVAHQTLELRAFFRQFRQVPVPDDYYRFVRGELSRKELFSAHPKEARAAIEEAWCVELGRVHQATVQNRVMEVLRGRKDWVLIGGPPCQAYSNIGRSRNKGLDGYVPEDDPRQYLYLEYLQVLADHKPAVFVMENVKGLLSASLASVSVFQRILEDLQSPLAALRRLGWKHTVSNGSAARYRIFSLEPQSLPEIDRPRDFLVRAEHHGIPQARHRVILLGIRDDLRSESPGTLKASELIGAARVLEGLPRLRSGMSNLEDSPQGWREVLQSAVKAPWIAELRTQGLRDVIDAVGEAVSSVKVPRHGRGSEFVKAEAGTDLEPDWFLDERLKGVCNHSTRAHMWSDLHRYLFAASFASARGRSPSLSDFPRSLLPEHASVTSALKGGYFSDRFRVQMPDRPATTVTSHISKDGHYYIHYDASQCRSLTVREAARLQTFPDNYFFCGGRTDQYRQVGNAVPPLMAKDIAKIVSNFLA